MRGRAHLRNHFCKRSSSNFRYMFEASMKNRFITLPVLMLAIVTIMSLLPFITKSFNIDEPVYLWIARHIQSNPLDFFGFKLNWYGIEMDVFSINKNPPFVPYYIALITGLFGWKETIIRIFFLVPAVGLSLGTYFLARSFCSSPHFAVMLTIFSPVFLVSSTNVTASTTMLAFYVWAIYLWLEGLKKESLPCLFISVIFIALATLTKYFGITLIPLLFVFTLVKKKRFDYRLCTLIIPVLLIISYEWLTYNLYNQGLFSDAAKYASERWVIKPSHILDQTLTGLSFTGGCLLGLTFFAPMLWPRRTLFLVTAILFVLSIFILISMGTIGSVKLYDEMESLGYKAGVRWGLIFQLTLFISSGIHILILAITDLMRHRDASSILLFLWIIGTFLFTSYFNWTTSARNIFPMLPAAAILVIRRINNSYKEPRSSKNWQVFWPLLPAALISFLVTWADFSLANSQRSAAYTIGNKLSDYKLPVTFQGHWGFQYYMEPLGYKAVDFRKEPSKGDIMIIPGNNTNTVWPNTDVFRLTGKIQEQPSGWLSVMKMGWSGFYSSVWGPLPFAVGEVSPEEFFVYMAE